MEQEGIKDTKNPLEVSSKPEPSENGGSKKDVENHPEGSSKPNKNTQRSLKAKPKIVKRSQASKIKTKNNKGAQQIWGEEKREIKKIVGKKESNRNGKEYVEKQISECCQQKRTTVEQPKEKSHHVEKNNEGSQNRSSSNRLLTEKSHYAKKNKENNIMSDKSKQKQKIREKHGGLKGDNRRKNKIKCDGMEKIGTDERKKEKLGGLIFMCNAKTKPDCFDYQVMGVSISKKDVVLGVKPGLKLFLYDFDLKLLYGVYKASSSGGMKLEPRAFGGSFPVQVRFSIDKDCFPLPESIFRKAIKENYNEKNKFKTELTVRQVRKLTELFRPAEIHSTLQPVRSPPRALMHDREFSDGVRGKWTHLHRRRPDRDPHERDPRYEWREEIPHDLFLTEKDYRAYGLQGDRRNVTSPSHMNPRLESYKRDYEREHLNQVGPMYRDNVPAHVESHRTDPLYLGESEFQAYGHSVGHDYIKDTYHAHRYGASSRDPYLPPFNREELSSSPYLAGGRTLVGADNLQRRETAQDRQYSTYAADALSDYNTTRRYHGSKLESTHVPVSSRYSFAGPSYSHR